MKKYTCNILNCGAVTERYEGSDSIQRAYCDACIFEMAIENAHEIIGYEACWKEGISRLRHTDAHCRLPVDHEGDCIYV